MQAMADTLAALSEGCAGDDRPDCPILTDLAAGPAPPAANVGDRAGAIS